MALDRTWIFAVLIEDVPGSLMDVVSTFSYRGVSIESVLGFGRHVGDTGLVVLGIRSSEKRSRELDRVVRRLPVVSKVLCFPAPDDDSRRTVLIERLKPAAAPAEQGLTMVPLTDCWALISGPEPEIRGFLRGSIDRAEVGHHVEVLLA
jgi:acetolactate synthase small subunit